MKLVNHQIIAAETGKLRPPQDSRGSEAVEPVSAVARASGGSAYNQSPEFPNGRFPNGQFPKPHTPDNSQAANFYLYTASLDAEPSELIGIDTYA